MLAAGATPAGPTFRPAAVRVAAGDVHQEGVTRTGSRKGPGSGARSRWHRLSPVPTPDGAHGVLCARQCVPLCQKVLKDLREAVSDRGRGVRGRGERPPTRGTADHRR